MKWNRHKLWAMLLIGLCCSSSAMTQELANYSATFVDIGFGARPLGMGRAYTALAADANAVVWNPAGMKESMAWRRLFRMRVNSI